MRKKISFIIPTFNEGRDIIQSLDELIHFVSRYEYEIIVVDDSTDDTFQVIKNHIHKNKSIDIRIIKGYKKGKGAAVRQGVLDSNGEIVFYLDADIDIPLGDIDAFVKEIVDNDYDIVIGKRLLDRKGRSLIRTILSLGLFFLQRFFVFNSGFFYDTQCGFKAFKGKAIKRLISKQKIERGMFDIELLYIARKLNLKISQLEVFPKPESRKSRIKLLNCFFNDPVDLVRIKLNGLQSKYND